MRCQIPPLRLTEQDEILAAIYLRMVFIPFAWAVQYFRVHISAVVHGHKKLPAGSPWIHPWGGKPDSFCDKKDLEI
jgi:hypothetical protein